MTSSSTIPILTYKPAGAGVHVDLDRLVASRMLVQANSGGGKSRAIRQLLEETHGRVQHLVIDPEGEFPTLRERFDYVLAAKHGGDVLASPRTARLLCRRLVELGASAVLDLYDLTLDERREFVRYFLTELMALPRALWHPIIVVIDEMHVFAPEAGQSQASEPVTALATQGRKRGFCLPPTEQIITVDGLRAIGSVKMGDLVLTHAGRFKPVSAVIRRQFSGTLYRVRSSNHFLDTTTTEDHQFAVHLVHNNGAGSRTVGELVWLPANQLVVGEAKTTTRTFSPCISEEQSMDLLAVTFPPRDREPKTAKGARRRGAGKVFSLPVTDALMRVAGFYLAEGSIGWRQHQRSKYPSKVIFNLGSDEEAFAAQIQVDLQELGIRSHRVRSGSSLRVGVASRGFAELMRHHFGEGAGRKRVPTPILRLPKPLLRHLFNAYLLGDGWSAPQDSFRATSATISYDLAIALKMLGEKLGLFTGLSRGAAEGDDTIQGRAVRRRQLYQLSFSETGGNAKRLDSGLACYSVRSAVDCEYVGEVVDLEVEDDHSFCTPSHVLHNCLVGATQRISKLHKDVAAELLNKMIGRTGLDIDVKRAGDELGMGKDDRGGLKTLAPGEFYVYGPAIANAVQIVRTGDVVTSHPEAGKVGAAPPAAPAKVRAMLAQLVDLPKEAEQEARTLEEFKRQNAELQRKLRAAEKSGTIVEKPVAVVDQKAIERAVGRALDAQAAAISKANWETMKMGRRAVEQLEASAAAISYAVPGLKAMLTRLETPVPVAPNGNGNGHRTADVPRVDQPSQMPSRNRTPAPARTVTPRGSSRDSSSGDLSRGQQKIVNALAELEAIGVESPSRAQLGMFAGYNLTGGTGGQHIADLNGAGLIDLPDKGVVRLTDAGRAAADAIDAPSALDELHDRMLSKLPEGQRKILTHLIALYPDAITRAELGGAVGYNLTGGTGGQHVADLVTMGAATLPQSGKVAAADILFPESLV